MPLIANSYGKARVRVMRIHRDGARNEVRELSLDVILHGGFERAYTDGDNRAVVATDTIKNIVNIVARENVQADAESFCRALCARFLGRYGQVDRVAATALETRWSRMEVAGALHPHAFLQDGNGRGLVLADLGRDGGAMRSGVDGFTFMKSTGSGWADYVADEYTTLKPTADRIAATSMNASWGWSSAPADYATANAAALRAMLEVFADTYSRGVQDSLYRMAEAALAAVPEISDVRLGCPNKHYLPIDLSPFGLSSDNMVFIPTDEPHGQIECTVAR